MESQAVYRVKRMSAERVLGIYHELQGQKDVSICTQPLPINPLEGGNGKRPNSLSVEDAFFGDSGKGSVVARFNELLRKKHGKLVSLRWNGGANAGHETTIDRKKIVTHQLPMGVITEGAVAIMTRGMVIHPEELVFEIKDVGSKFGGRLPGELVIDARAVLALDTHRALELTLNEQTDGGKGSTGRGIATAYASFYLRHPVTVKDMMDSKWEEKLREHYRLYRKFVAGFGNNLEDILIFTPKNSENKQPVGTEAEFIARLEPSRRTLKKYVSPNVFEILKEKWNTSGLPFTCEGAQGAGIDPYHGVFPDITASRPMSRNINDATYNVVLPEELSFRVAVMKTTYMSSVGARVIPDTMTERDKKQLQGDFHEVGRSTGRPRGILAVSIPIAEYLHRAAGYEYLVATHLDAAKEGRPIQVVTHYTDKATGEEASYFPYQDAIDCLVPHVVEFEGWDGEAVKKVKSPKDLPLNARLYLAFLSRTIAPIAIATTGPDVGASISWLPSGSL